MPYAFAALCDLRADFYLLSRCRVSAAFRSTSSRLPRHAPGWLLPAVGVTEKPPVKDLITNGGARLLNQVNYSQVAVTHGRCSIADPDADLGTSYTASAEERTIRILSFVATPTSSGS